MGNPMARRQRSRASARGCNNEFKKLSVTRHKLRKTLKKLEKAQTLRVAPFLLAVWVSLQQGIYHHSASCRLAWTCATYRRHAGGLPARGGGGGRQCVSRCWRRLVGSSPECRAGVAVDWSLGVVRSAALPACGAIFFNT